MPEIQPKELPILFSAPMVRAILDGRKTVTRRVVKGDQIPKEDPAETDPSLRWTAVGQHDSRYGFVVNGDTAEQCALELARCGRCPYGKPGGRLWVRETIYAWGRWETRYSEKKGRDEWHFIDMTLECGKQYRYPASMIGANGTRQRGCVTPQWWKRPAIHAPRAASRILLEITAVRVERLQDISEEQAEAEGVHRAMRMWFATDDGGPSFTWPQHAFEHLWRKINGAESWEANPWVCAVDFKRITPPALSTTEADTAHRRPNPALGAPKPKGHTPVA
ncbi:hypothetical protein [Devosia sp.]|uniref:hypothetical protein n=1 Tax=Devosia sp. TaxID=1871048 RepID=UPI002FC732EB